MNVNNHYVSAGQLYRSMMEGRKTSADTQTSYKRTHKLIDIQGEPT
ncbi:hypothetical protein SAMN05443144_10525 [Fodinibius roseus]|uniref:Uncharacterized protein n=1 Tax=Fodinibius roseus TaxID=1194090 RepID=A0A1M4YC13_9BACT|nr:hypothetical protein [Fodinibius roseus]SHF03275.1 hypothetical protein SAMN05443144_10525 [Fodinibius roseus]